MNKFKAIGMTMSVVGFIATMIGNWASEKQQDKVIDDKIKERLASK